MDRVEQPARQTTDDGAVDADVLQVVPGMLLDEPDRAFGAERQHTVLDELREPLVMALDDLEHPRLGPPVELLAKILVGGQRPAGALESFHDPDAHFGARPLGRAIQNEIADPLAEMLLLAAFAAGDAVKIDAVGGKLAITKSEPVEERKPEPVAP